MAAPAIWPARIPVLAATALLAAFQMARAEDMAVYTTVTLQAGGAKSTVVGRSLTLFHAGKVYDWMEDVGEVVILETVHNRFVVLSGNSVASRVEFSELQQFLKVAQFEAEKYLQDLAVSNQRNAKQVAKYLEFQLQPSFEEKHEPTLDLLTLRSPLMDYSVQTARTGSAELVQQYLTYADWAARLNYVLHPRSSYPEPRLILNAKLREKGLLPIRVMLENRTEGKTVIRADHKFQWQLHSADKAHINKWERLLDSDKVQWVSFHDYQQRLLAETKAASK